MDSETIDAVTDWETVAVGDGYRGLHDLADAGFTGAVTDGLAWAFALNGRVVGVFEGTVEDFEGADLTAYRAPDSALPLLYAMQERGGETQAKYYTQEMSLGEADETLRSGNFTGYVRLSENVLSGDYYVVYYGGKSMSVAFVGNSRRLLTGDEAFERADDEVGIYEVVDVDVDIVELPDAPEPEPEPEPDPEPTAASAERSAPADEADGASAGAGEDESDAPEPTADDDAADETAAVTFGGEDGDDADVSAGGEADPAASEAEAGVADPEAADPGPARDESAGETAPEPTADTDAPADAADADTPPTEAVAEAATDDGAAGPRPERSRKRDRDPASAEAAAAADDDVFSEEEEWREARAIPSLDPTQSEEGRADAASGGRAAAATEAKRRKRDASAPERGRERPSPPKSVSRSGSASETESETSASRSRSRSGAKSASASAAASHAEAAETDDSSTADLRERLEEATAARERLESERDELEAERDEYREEAERLQSRVEQLEAEIDRLESRLSEASAGEGAATPDRTMSAAEALTGTNLFVRYDSKADPTLEDAHGGGARRDEVNDNLRVEHHTQFDTDGLRVDGKPFEEFLRDTIEYRFVEWVVRDLLYDVQATRARSELQDLYDVIPRIDRVEIDGTVSVPVGDAEDEEAGGEEEAFDVVLWDGRGNPLVVADLNTSRDPATESMVTSLISDASAVGESHDTLGAAFYVTASYFEPGALDAVGDATGGGLLSRNKRRSFVKLARKQGYHLCLVEARNREFHVSVPDL